MYRRPCRLAQLPLQQGRRHRTAGRPIKQFDSVNDRRAREARDLHHASEISGGNNIRIDTIDVSRFAFAERRGDVRLQQIVSSG